MVCQKTITTKAIATNLNTTIERTVFKPITRHRRTVRSRISHIYLRACLVRPQTIPLLNPMQQRKKTVIQMQTKAWKPNNNQ